MADRRILPDPPVSIMISGEPQLQELVRELPKYADGKWKHLRKLIFEYDDFATISIPFNEDSWRDGYLNFGTSTTVKPARKEYLNQDEIKNVMDSFFNEVLDPYCNDHKELIVKRWE